MIFEMNNKLVIERSKVNKEYNLASIASIQQQRPYLLATNNFSNSIKSDIKYLNFFCDIDI